MGAAAALGDAFLFAEGLLTFTIWMGAALAAGLRAAGLPAAEVEAALFLAATGFLAAVGLAADFAAGLAAGFAADLAAGFAAGFAADLAAGLAVAAVLRAGAFLAAGFFLPSALASSDAVILRGLTAPSFKRTGVSPQISSRR